MSLAALSLPPRKLYFSLSQFTNLPILLFTISEADSYANVQLSRGVLLRLSGNLNDSIECFEEIIHLSPAITTDTHLPPLACLELAISYIELDDFVQAKKYIEAGWSYSSKFLCQLYVHVRLHSAQKYIDLRKKQIKRQQSSDN